MTENPRNRTRNEAIEKIESYILKNKLNPHDKIPSERDLCELWDFNRTTLRSAIQHLIIEGKLYQKKGSGTYIAKKKLVRNLQDLKSLAVVVGEQGQALESQILSQERIESNKQITKKLRLPLGHQVFALTRLRSIDGEPFTIETSFLDYQRFSDLEHHDFSKESLYEVLEKEYKICISKGEETVGIAYASETESELLDIPVGHALFYLTGVVYDEDGAAVEYFKSVIRSDKMRFSSVLRRVGDRHEI